MEKEKKIKSYEEEKRRKTYIKHPFVHSMYNRQQRNRDMSNYLFLNTTV